MASKSHVISKHHRQTLPFCLREIFEASFWKKMHHEFTEFEKDRTRWTLPMMAYAGLFMALDSASTEGERFEKTAETLAGLFPKRKRCGNTLAGYNLALADLPWEVFDRLRDRMHAVAEQNGLKVAQVGRWEAFGIDGSKQTLPRTEAHENHYGIVTKGAIGAERLVVTAVALRRYVLWDWACDSAIGSERALALDVIGRLPLEALAVLDAGFIGYEWGLRVIESGRHFLARVGGNVKLWIDSLPTAEWREGEVWLWPERKGEGIPLVLRLIRLELPCRSKRGKREEMWLVTDVLESERLTVEESAGYYRKRWPANECTFRSWKRTLYGEKAASRTPAMAEPECHFSLCALMLLQLSVCLARRKVRHNRRVLSVAKAKRVWARAARGLARGQQRKKFMAELAECCGDTYRRRKPRVKRTWPARKQHRALKSPVFRKLDKQRKRLGLLHLEAQKRVAS
jgi:hypothetical protein